MTAATLQENKMGVMPVGKLIANMALHMVISMLVQALYNVVDSIYVSQVSESAVTALSLACLLYTSTQHDDCMSK